MPFSFLSLCMASAKAYHHQRLEHLADPNPPFSKNLALVFPPYLIITLTYVVTWAVIFAHVKAIVIVMVIATVILNWFLFGIFRIERSMASRQARGPKWKKDVTDLKWNCVFTSVLSPCVVGSHRTHLLSLYGLSASLCLGLWLQCTVLLVNRRPLDRSGNPPVTYCFRRGSGDGFCSGYEPQDTCSLDKPWRGQACLFGNRTDVPDKWGIWLTGVEEGSWIYHCQAWLLHCSIFECMPRIRICNKLENPMDLLTSTIIPILNVFLVLSFLLCCLLRVLSDYGNVFKFTNFLTCGRGGFLHRSLLCSLATYGDHKELGKIVSLTSSTTLKRAINRPDFQGNTPLHIASRKGYARCVKILLERGAKPRRADASGRMPHHLAAMNGTIGCLRQLCQVLEKEHLVDSTDALGSTALDLALREGRDASARFLVCQVTNRSITADDLRSKRGNVLHLACMRPSARNVESILRADYHGRRLDQGRRRAEGLPSRRQLATEKDNSWMTPFHYAVKYRHLDNLLLLLRFLKSEGPEMTTGEEEEEEGLEFPSVRMGWTPLHMAARTGDLECCKLIIDYLALSRDAFLRTCKATGRHFPPGKKGSTLMQYAMYRRSTLACKILLDFGSTPDVWGIVGSLFKREDDGTNVLNFQLLEKAVATNYNEVLDLFLDHLESEGRGLSVLLSTTSNNEEEERVPSSGTKNVEGMKLFLHAVVAMQHSARMLEKVLGRIGRDSAVLRDLLDRDSKVLGRSLLEAAVKEGSGETCRVLMEYGAALPYEALEVSEVTGDQPLHRPWLMEFCVKTDQPGLLRSLFADGRVFPGCSRDAGQLGQLIDGYWSTEGTSLVYSAATRGRVGCLEVLLDFGATASAWKEEEEKEEGGIQHKPGRFSGAAALLHEVMYCIWYMSII